MKLTRRIVVSSLLAAALHWGVGVGAAPSNNVGEAFVRSALDEQVDALVRDGFERPVQALAALKEIQQERAQSAEQHRVLLQAMGSINAQTGNAAAAGAIAEELLALSPNEPGSRAVASSNLVRAQVAETAGQLDVAAALAQSALPAFMTGCPGSAAKPVALDASSCSYRAAWRALQILERRAMSQGVPVTAAAHAQAALALAEWAGDLRRQSDNQSSLAFYAQGRGDRDLAQRLLAQARRLAAHVNDPAQLATVCSAEARIAVMQGDRKAALQPSEEALSLAVQANTPRLEARMLNNLSDIYAGLGRPADALRAAERGLEIVHRHNDMRAERVLMSNAGVAKIGLGRIIEGKQDMARVLELWKQSGETGRQAETMLEFGEALAAAGDSRSALEIYHREQTLSAELMRVNRDIALKELQTRNAAEARQRDIELLERDNALKTAALANRDLLQRIWWLLATVMLLAIVLVALLYRRVREANRRLAASHVQLQAQSERDPLTNLANRRHFQAVMARLDRSGLRMESASVALKGAGLKNSSTPRGAAGFEGALLLVDLDHFKRVNDVYGHAAGDQVLIEVAKRLNEAVRNDDLVVRWGGEEFLILAPRAASDHAEQMATRVLRMLADTPINVGTHSLRVTASIGYARFPLPPYSGDVPWEQAINLADMALYTAKNQGRNRAFGIVSTTASSVDALRSVEEDFDRAWHEGRVTLLQTPGPELRDSVLAA